MVSCCVVLRIRDIAVENRLECEVAEVIPVLMVQVLLPDVLLQAVRPVLLYRRWAAWWTRTASWLQYLSTRMTAPRCLCPR